MTEERESGFLHKIAVISDTHGLIRPEAAGILSSAELILHAGDFADREVFDRLKGLGRLIAVRGNCDGDWAENIPGELLLELYGKRIYMIHDKKKLSKKADSADLIVYGHSHKYKEKERDGRLWLNPGSCGPERPGRAATMAVLELDAKGGELRIRRVDLGRERPGEASGRTKSPDILSGDLQRAVQMVVGDLEKGRSVDRIVKKRGLDRELTEQICQIYFTHPGIDIQGVLNRIEIAGL